MMSAVSWTWISIRTGVEAFGRACGVFFRPARPVPGGGGPRLPPDLPGVHGPAGGRPGRLGPGRDLPGHGAHARLLLRGQGPGPPGRGHGHGQPQSAPSSTASRSGRASPPSTPAPSRNCATSCFPGNAATVGGWWANATSSPPTWSTWWTRPAWPGRSRWWWTAATGRGGCCAPRCCARPGPRSFRCIASPTAASPTTIPIRPCRRTWPELAARVVAEGADFGLGLDGDADRLGVVDETGRLLYGDQLLALLARSVLMAHPGASIIGEGQVQPPAVRRHRRPWRRADHVPGRPLADQGAHARDRGAARRRDERPHLLCGPLLRLRRRHLRGHARHRTRGRSSKHPCRSCSPTGPQPPPPRKSGSIAPKTPSSGSWKRPKPISGGAFP